MAAGQPRCRLLWIAALNPEHESGININYLVHEN